MFQEGERGYLEGLASRYADLFRTHYGDVLEPLEELRRRETNATGRMPNTQLTTSHSQPIYVPGKYSVSPSYSPLFAALSRLDDRRFCRFIASANGGVMRSEGGAQRRLSIAAISPYYSASPLTLGQIACSKGSSSREEQRLVRYATFLSISLSLSLSLSLASRARLNDRQSARSIRVTPESRFDFTPQNVSIATANI
jgi:hypothetical protein